LKISKKKLLKFLENHFYAIYKTLVLSGDIDINPAKKKDQTEPEKETDPDTGEVVEDGVTDHFFVLHDFCFIIAVFREFANFEKNCEF